MAAITLDTDPKTLIPAYDESLAAAAQLLDERVESEEELIRGSAEKWTAGVSALLSLFGLTALVTGKDGIFGLPERGRWLGLILAVGALFAAGRAIVFGYRAAYGWPELTDVSNDALLARWYEDRRSRLSTAADELKSSVGWAFATLALLLGLLAAVLLYPRTPSTSTIRVEFEDDSRVCGTLLETSDDSIMRIRVDDGEVRVVDLTQLQEIKVVKEC